MGTFLGPCAARASGHGAGVKTPKPAPLLGFSFVNTFLGVIFLNRLGSLCASGEVVLRGYERVYREGDTFICEGPEFPPRVQAIPEGFWKQVRQLHFALHDGKDGLVCDFLKQYGTISGQDDLEGLVHPIRGTQITVRTIEVALSYFVSLTSLFDNITVGNTGYIRETLGGNKSSPEPWVVYLPENGFSPYQFFYAPPPQEDSLYRLDDDDRLLREEVYRAILTAVEDWLRSIPWRLTTLGAGKGAVRHAWSFLATNWFQAAMLSWYLERIACLEPCVCGCGRPARPGSKYADEKCAARHRKRQQRERKGEVRKFCPTCGQVLSDSEARRRVGQNPRP